MLLLDYIANAAGFIFAFLVDKIHWYIGYAIALVAAVVLQGFYVDEFIRFIALAIPISAAFIQFAVGIVALRDKVVKKIAGVVASEVELQVADDLKKSVANEVVEQMWARIDVIYGLKKKHEDLSKGTKHPA